MTTHINICCTYRDFSEPSEKARLKEAAAQCTNDGLGVALWLPPFTAMIAMVVFLCIARLSSQLSAGCLARISDTADRPLIRL
jgi:hypothetical protein